MRASRDVAEACDLGAIADRIAECVVERLAAQIAELVDVGSMPGWETAMASSVENAPHPPRDATSDHDLGLWTARRVAEHFDVSANFVYGHAKELGCIRLGTGPCARLRFDPQLVRERWSTVGQSPGRRRRARNSADSQRRRPVSGNDGDYELLDFDRQS